MGTRWWTEPLPQPHRLHTNMPPTAANRPQIYVHFEFGVSFSPRNPPNSHAVTYMSRNIRERSHSHHHFPRQVPPASTNFLRAPNHARSVPRDRQLPQAQPRAQPQLQAHSQQHPHAQPPWETQRHREAQGYREPQRQLGPPQEERRSSRQESRSSGSSHERGSSAPPPWNDSPWDAEPEPIGSSALPRQRQRPPPQLWKALPEVPANFRLGEDEMPWAAWSWPGEYVGDGHDEESFSPFANRPTMLPSSALPRSSYNGEDDPGRVQELEALSAAMMTVDNGFEGQWWNQGDRVFYTTTAPAGDLFASSTSAPASAAPVGNPRDSVGSMESVGWAVARDEPYSYPFAQTSLPSAGTQNMIVSPMTEYESPRLTRSMTTRSEELFLPL